MAEEVIGPRADGTHPDLAAVLAEGDCADFELHPDADWDRLPHSDPDGGVSFGERDRRLAVATDAAGEQADEEVWLVTDDEDFMLCLLSCIHLGLTSVFPVASGHLLLYLHDCGALTVDQMVAVLEAEDARLENNLEMQDRKRWAKQEALAGIAARLGVSNR